MKISNAIAAVIVATIISVQGWTLLEVVNLKVQVARLTDRIEQTTRKK